jgi:hypothetical protein
MVTPTIVLSSVRLLKVDVDKEQNEAFDAGTKNLLAGGEVV